MLTPVLCVVVLCCIHGVTAPGGETDGGTSAPDEELLPTKHPTETKALDVPNRLSIVERMRQSAYDIAGRLFETGEPAREAVRGKANAVNEALHQVGAQAMEAVANTEYAKHFQVALQLWNEIRRNDKTEDEKINMLVDMISEKALKKLKKYTKLQPMELESKSKFICAAKGFMRDLTTIEEVDRKVVATNGDPNNELGFTIDIVYKFRDLHFEYTVFYIKVLKSLEKSGYLDLKFNENNVKITLKIPNLKNILWNLSRNQCVIHVVDFKVTRLDFVKSSFTGPKKSWRRKMLGRLIFEFLQSDQSMLRKKFEQRTTVEIHRALQTQDAWLCKDQQFRRLVKARDGSLEDFVASSSFETYCGQDLFIENLNGDEKPQP